MKNFWTIIGFGSILIGAVFFNEWIEQLQWENTWKRNLDDHLKVWRKMPEAKRICLNEQEA